MSLFAINIVALLVPLPDAQPSTIAPRVTVTQSSTGAQPPTSQNPSAQGTDESPKKKAEPLGFTLDKLRGMPMIRPQYVQPQTQVWVYPVYFGGYQGNSYNSGYGLGGYRPPGTGSYSQSSYFFVR
jgi:hypothetical protein